MPRFDDPISQNIQWLEDRIVQLRDSTHITPDQLPSAVFEELKNSLEELQVLNEKLEQQNRELQAARAHMEEEGHRYQELFDQASDGYAVTDLAGNIQEANLTLGRQLGLTPERLRGRLLAVFVAPQERQDFTLHLRHLEQHQRPAEFETTLQRMDKYTVHTFPAFVTVNPVRDSQQRVTGLRWLVRDMTQYKREETERAEQQELIISHQEVLQELSDGIEDFAVFLLDPWGHIATWNRGAQEIKGYEAAEIIGRHFSCFYPQEDVEEGKPQRFLEMAATGRNIEDEGWRVRKNGERFWANVLITALRAPGGELRGFAKVVRDMTERKQAEADRIRLRELTLQQEEWRRLQTLIDTSPVGVMVVDARARQLALVNQEANRLWGDSYLPGKPLGECGPEMTYRRPDGQQWEASDLPVWRALNYGETSRAEEVIAQSSDGHTFPTLVNASPVYSEEGQIISAVVTIQDITPLQEVEKLRNEFLGMVTHDLRVPLSTIKGSAAIGLRSRLSSHSNDGQELFRTIEEQVDQMTDLVGSLLDMTRIEAGTFSVYMEPTDLASVVVEAVKSFSRLYPRCEIVLQAPPDLPMVQADQRRIVQVLKNLLDNAARFSPPDSPVTIALEDQGGLVTVQVIDQGPGIPQEKLPHLFKRFPRIEERYSGPDLGAGLGLAICWGIVEAHGEHIWAESGPEGTGTTISFTLSLASEAARASTPEASAGEAFFGENGAPVRNIKILVVDDDQNTLRFLRRLLQEAGYEPIVISDPGEAAETVQETAPDLALLDLMLPNSHGVDLMRSIRESSDVPVIFLTARDSRDEMVNALKMGGDDYITKPFSESELLGRIEAVLRRKGQRQSVENTPPYQFEGLAIDFSQRRVTVEGEEVPLSATEYKLLCALANHSGRILTHDQILQLVWSDYYSGETDLLRTTVRRLRQKLGDNAKNPRYIITVPQVGYRMPLPPTSQPGPD